MLLLHTTGARSGKKRVNPLGYQPLDGSYAVFATNAGASSHSDRYHNLRANPDASIEVGGETVQVIAREATGAERDEIWERQKIAAPGFARYEQKTDRVFPVIVLDRA